MQRFVFALMPLQPVCITKQRGCSSQEGMEENLCASQSPSMIDSSVQAYQVLQWIRPNHSLDSVDSLKDCGHTSTKKMRLQNSCKAQILHSLKQTTDILVIARLVYHTH